jgi:catechol 2,3-dioxygenase-like lactoylglutathione lyase family enzyme
MVEPVEGVLVLFGGIPVADFEAALPWYERLLGHPPDMVPKEGEACWKLSDEAWIYVVRDAERAGKALITVIVEELPAAAGQHGEEGGLQTLVVADPDGNEIKFARPPD